eukprot:1931808-Pleurochrysis_carterae.AAC.1
MRNPLKALRTWSKQRQHAVYSLTSRSALDQNLRERGADITLCLRTVTLAPSMRVRQANDSLGSAVHPAHARALLQPHHTAPHYCRHLCPRCDREKDGAA